MLINKLLLLLCLFWGTHSKRHLISKNQRRRAFSLYSRSATQPRFKRTNNAAHHDEGSYHRGVPEHFLMHENGPEIHLDIDEHGTTVDTHPASLNLDTATRPHEHCCHHCHQHCHRQHHGCQCHMCDGCRRRTVKGNQDDDNEEEGERRNLHLRKIPPSINRALLGNNCYGGVCTTTPSVDFVYNKQSQPQAQLAEPSMIDARPRLLQHMTDVGQMTGSQLIPGSVQAEVNPPSQHPSGMGVFTDDPHVEHVQERTGETRTNIQKYTKPDKGLSTLGDFSRGDAGSRVVTFNKDSGLALTKSVPVVERGQGRSKVITFNSYGGGLSLRDGQEFPHLSPADLALKRSSVNKRRQEKRIRFKSYFM